MPRFAKLITIDIPVPLQVFHDLCEHREKSGCKTELHEMAGQAIEQWLARQHQQAGTDRMPRRALHGYQWKRLFLPDGTVLRSAFKGESYLGRIERGKILHNGRVHSPSEFANAAGSVGRNAWQVIWLLFPGERDWKLAGDCRSRPVDT
jgi:hypothetical protein